LNKFIYALYYKSSAEVYGWVGTQAQAIATL